MVFNRFLKVLKRPPRSRKLTDFQFEYNHPVTLTVENSDEEYGTIVYDYGEAEISVFVPRGKKTSRLLKLEVGDTVFLTVPQRDGVYQGYTQVAEVRSRPDQLIILAVPEYWEGRQNRQFYRLPVQLPIRYAPVTNRGLNPEDFRSSLTVDLSGGGAKFPVSDPHRRGDLLYVHFDILTKGKIHSVILTGEVRRIEQSLTLGTIAAVQFVDVTEREQRLLVEWVSSQQGEGSG